MTTARRGSGFKHLARLIYRTSDDRRLARSPLHVRAKYTLVLTFLAAALTLVGPVLSEQLGAWNKAVPNVALPESDWRVLYRGQNDPCPNDARAEHGCPASPASRLLWTSTFTRADGDHIKRLAGLSRPDYWIGVSIDPATLRQAYRQRANEFLLGWILGAFRVWVDGQLVLSADQLPIDPVSFTVPMSRLAEPRPLQLAIEILPELGRPFPDFLNIGLGGSGLMTHERLDAYRMRMNLTTRIRSFAFFLANMLIALFFLSFWAASATKADYFYMGMYCIVVAIEQLLVLDVIRLHLPSKLSATAGVLLALYDGVFAMFVGLSFARVRSNVFRKVSIVALLAPIAWSIAIYDHVSRTVLTGLIFKFALPPLYLAGAVACLFQAAYLRAEKRGGTYLPKRIRKLSLVALGLVGLAVLDFLVAAAMGSWTQHSLWERTVHLGFVFMLGALIFDEYSEREKLIEKSPVSEYHQRPELPTQLAGAILIADLKNSEPFFKHRAHTGAGENPIGIWRSHFYTCILKHGGTVIQRRGDEIVGFFDKDKSSSPASSALLAADEMAALSALLEVEFQSLGLYPAGAKGFHFRGAVCLGAVRPVWEKIGPAREAYWEEAGNTTPFVECARLLELERKLDADDNASRIVLRDELAAVLARETRPRVQSFSARGIELIGKHGTVFKVAVYEAGVGIRSRKKAQAA